MTENELCRICQKPKGTSSAGLVTQFIDVCHCDANRFEQEITITVCKVCDKRIASRPGSMTQWIFKQGLCKCETPEPLESSVESFIQPAFKGGKDDQEEEVLQLDPEKFPVDRYSPLAELGRGAAGIVYLCRDKLLNKIVAVKTLLSLTPDQFVSFQAEARATAKLDHPNIVKVLDFGGTDSGTPYMVMDYVPGISLENYLSKYGVLEADTARFVFSQLADALSYAHKQKIFHRDLKPSNIVLYEVDGGIDVTLLDFGLAKLRETTGITTIYEEKTIAGTPNFMSPDPIKGKSYDARSEIYCLGCVLFAALSGRPPFVGETVLETLSMHAKHPSPALSDVLEDADRSLETIVSMCLAKEKESRYDSMLELKNALKIDTTTKSIETVEDAPRVKLKVKSIVIASSIFVFAVFSAVWYIFDVAKPAKQLKSKTVSKEKKKKTKETKDLPPSLIRYPKSVKNSYLLNGQVEGDRSKLAFLKGRRDIESLKIAAANLKGNTLDYVEDLPLKSFGLRECDLDKESIIRISRIRTLKDLRITAADFSGKDLESLKALSLTTLELEGCRLDSASLEAVAECKSIRNLSLLGSSTQNTFSILAKLPVLDNFEITGSKINPKDFENLYKLRALKRLNIKESLPKEFLDVTKRLNLETLLVMNNDEITEDELLQVSRIKTLKYFEVISCKKITHSFAKKFREHRKNCLVLVSYRDK